MKNFIFCLFFILLFNAVKAQQVTDAAQSVDDDVVYTEQDVAIFSEIVKKFKPKKDESIGELIPDIGSYFIGNEYVAHTLEVGDEEKLVVNLRELDCTTYAEYLLAMARTIKSEEATFQRFTKELEKIRYRDGQRGEYPTRLHYFSDWIYNNKENNLVTTPADSFGEPFYKHINFMTTHTDSYKQLSGNPEFISVIAQHEENLSDRDYYYIPREKIAEKEHLLQEGDIIGLTTDIEGLDISHVGVLVEKDGRMHLLHASQSKLKVEISDEPISSFLKPNSKNTGIMVARPVN